MGSYHGIIEDPIQDAAQISIIRIFFNLFKNFIGLFFLYIYTFVDFAYYVITLCYYCRVRISREHSDSVYKLHKKQFE